MIQGLRVAVISDTDILVHLVRSKLFPGVISLLLKRIIIPTKVEQELERSHPDVYAVIKPLLNQGDWLVRSSTIWKETNKDQKVEINKTKTRMRAQLDPGELDCYAYSVGFQIDAVISNDKGARETIGHDSGGKKVVLNFGDLFILGAKKDLWAWSDAGAYYDQVVRERNLIMPRFEIQIANFEKNVEQHAWVQEFLAM